MAVGPSTTLLSANRDSIATATKIFENGGLVAFPTETVYGLGADAANPAAVASLYEAKGRPSFNPLIAHVADLAAAQRIARFTPQALALAAAFWPGPLTLVLEKTPECTVCDLATAGLDTVGIRIPSHPVAQTLLRAFGGAVVAPSANQSGHVSPTTALHVASDLNGRIDLILDGGPVHVGVESTIIGCFADPVLLRPGGVPTAEIERVLGQPIAIPQTQPSDDERPIAPGMLTSHYAPRARVRLNATTLHNGEALLAFGPNMPAGLTPSTTVLNLSERSDLAEAAANLFGHLRSLDTHTATGIAVMPVPDHGLGEAINDRLRRAAAPK